MREGGSNRSLQLVEWGLGLAIAGVMLSAALPAMRTVEESPVARATVQQIQELMVLARDEAVRTGRQHVVFFEQSQLRLRVLLNLNRENLTRDRERALEAHPLRHHPVERPHLLVVALEDHGGKECTSVSAATPRSGSPRRRPQRETARMVTRRKTRAMTP